MSPEIGNFTSKRWMLAVRAIMILLGIIQAIFIYWAKYITAEVVENKSQLVEVKSDITHVKDDVSYIRTRIDSIFELKRR